MDTEKTFLHEFVENKIEKCRLLVVGDVMLDKYYYSEVKKISPEAPVPVAKVIRQKETLGGAANVAHNLALLGCKTYLAGAAGQDYHRSALERQLSEKGIDPAGLITTAGPTTTKLRVIGGHQQMIRLDFEETGPLATAEEDAFEQYFAEVFAAGLDGVIVSDYAKGVCTEKLCQYLIKHCRQQAIPIIIDPKGNQWEKYRGADYLTPNLKELNEVTEQEVLNEDLLVESATQGIKATYGLENIMVTRSERGLSLIGPKATHIPTLAQEVFDVSGAGDTVIAVMGLALAGKIPAEMAAYLANLAASVVVAKVGTYAISRAELLAALERV